MRREASLIKAVVFDCGGVLTLEQDATVVAQIAFFLGVEPETLARVYMEGRGEYDRGVLSPESYWKAVAEKTSARFETSMVPRLVDLDMSSWFRHNRDVLRIIMRLEEAGIPLFMLSNMNFDGKSRLLGAFGNLDGVEWISKFKAILLSCDLGMVKPEPDIYQACIAISGLEPYELLFIDDMETNILAAGRQGMKAHRFSDAGTLEALLSREGLFEGG